MSRVIEGDTVQKDYYPVVSIREIGNFVKGKVIAKHTTNAGNPAIDMELIDLEGSTSKSVSKGVYKEVEVKVGDPVTLIGTTKQLKDKLPKLMVSDVVTVTFKSTLKVNKGTMKVFEVLVD